MRDDILCNNGTKPSALDPNCVIGLSAHSRNLHPDVLSLPIAIRPNHENLSTTRLCCEVILDILPVRGYCCFHRSVKEFKRVARMPFAVGLIEVLRREMSRNACHGEERLGLRVVEFIVLDVGAPCRGLGEQTELTSTLAGLVIDVLS